MRIKFSGNWDKIIKNYYNQLNYKYFRIAIFIATIILMSMCVSAILIFHKNYIVAIYSIVFLVVIIFFAIVLIWFPNIILSKKMIESSYSQTVIIENNDIICEGKVDTQEFCKRIKDVKKIIEYEKFYLIKFFLTNIIIICQKDLIVQGTIEEFEELFADKIIRKVK